MKDKGFTLVELLGVIAILGAIALITLPIVSTVIKNNKNRILKEQKEFIVKSAKVWSEDNLANVYKDRPQYVSLSQLQSDKYLDKKNIIDPITKKEMDGCVKITYSTEYNQYDYEYQEDCEGKFYVDPKKSAFKNGKIVYYNPVDGTICSAATSVSTTGTKTGCMKWYIFNDSVGKEDVNMILDHNTTSNVVWNSSNVNINGPLEVINQLYRDTDSWAGLDNRSDTYEINSESFSYTVSYQNHKARMITANEVAKISNNTDFSSATSLSTYKCYFENNSTTKPDKVGDYGWLIDGLSHCAYYGCPTSDSKTDNEGYWTVSSTVNQTSSWVIQQYDSLMSDSITSTKYGVRPVITIPKGLVV